MIGAIFEFDFSIAFALIQGNLGNNFPKLKALQKRIFVLFVRFIGCCSFLFFQLAV